MPNKIATLPSSLPVDPERYFIASSNRRWELTINWKLKVYLTDNEKDYFLEQLKLGKKIISVGDMVLTKRFDCLIPVRKKLENKEGITYY